MSFLSKLVNLIKVEFKFDLKQQLLDKIREPYNLKNIQNANNTWDFEDDVFKRVKNFTKGGDVECIKDIRLSSFIFWLIFKFLKSWHLSNYKYSYFWLFEHFYSEYKYQKIKKTLYYYF